MLQKIQCILTSISLLHVNILEVALGGLSAICCSRSAKLYSPATIGGNHGVKTQYPASPNRLSSSETALKLHLIKQPYTVLQHHSLKCTSMDSCLMKNSHNFIYFSSSRKRMYTSKEIQVQKTFKILLFKSMVIEV